MILGGVWGQGEKDETIFHVLPAGQPVIKKESRSRYKMRTRTVEFFFFFPPSVVDTLVEWYRITRYTGSCYNVYTTTNLPPTI